MDVDLDRIWASAPIGITVYEPVFVSGTFDTMVLRWVNAAVASRADYTTAEMIGWTVGQVIGEANWHSLRHRYADLIAGKVPSIGYARVYDNAERNVSFAYEVTAWYAAPWVAIQVRETSSDPLPFQDKNDIEAALRLVKTRSEQTLRLAEMLVDQKEVDAAMHT